jgi:hypothetical protein
MANAVLYGYYNLGDLRSQRVTEVGVETVGNAIQLALAEHNRQLNALMDFFVRRTTEYSRRYRQAAAARNQPLNPDGRALPIKRAGFYDVAFPIQMSGNAWGNNFVTGEKMTVEEANDVTDTILQGDARWVRDHILAGLFTNVTWTFPDELQGNLTIQPLANADTVTYQIINGADSGATADHFLAQADAIADATNPFPTIYSTLTLHPENTGEVVAFIPNGLTASVEALANFMPVADPNVRLGANTDTLIGTLPGQMPGRLLGYVDRVWVVEWRGMPANYIAATMTGGERALAMREDPEESLRGFRERAVRADYPWYERQYFRRAGFGAWNRVGALVYRIGNGTYAIPTNYGSPMP